MRNTYLLTTLCALALAGALNAADAGTETPATAVDVCTEQVVGEAIRGWRLVHDGKGGVCACKDGARIPLYNSGVPQLQVETLGDNWICKAGENGDLLFIIRVDEGPQQPALVFISGPGDSKLMEATETGGYLHLRLQHHRHPHFRWETDFTIPKEIPQELQGQMPYISTLGGEWHTSRGDTPPYQQLNLPQGEALIMEDIGSGTYVYRYSILNAEGRVSRSTQPTHTAAHAITLWEGTCTLCNEKGQPITTLPIQEGDSAPAEFHSVYGQGFGLVIRRPITVERKGEGYFLIHGPARVEIGFATPEVQKALDALLDKEDGCAEAIGILHEEITSSGRPRISPWCRESDLEGTGLTPPGGAFHLQQKIILHRVLPTPEYPQAQGK